MAGGCSLWLTAQVLWSTLEVFYRKPVPNPFVGDIALFLHLVPLMAMLALRADQVRTRRRYLDQVDFGMLFVWWVYLYLFIVIPWQYVRLNSAFYSENFDNLYLAEHLVLLCSLVYVWARSSGPWKQVYAQLLCASLLYALSSIAGSMAITRNEYYTGSVFDIPLVAAELWFCIVPITCRELGTKTEDNDSTEYYVRQVVPWAAKLVILSMPAFAGWAFFISGAPWDVDRFRVFLSLVISIILIAFVALRQGLVENELVSLISTQEEAILEMGRLQQHLVQSEKLLSLSSVVGPAAREIGQPIRSVIRYSEALLQTRNLETNEKTVAEKIGLQAHRMINITEQLLSFGQPISSKRMPVDLSALVSMALKLYHPQLCAKNITLVARFLDSPLWVEADSNQIIRVFVNIVQNATEAMSSGGGTLQVELKEQNGIAVAEFLDDGRGIKEPLRIFDPFYTTKPLGQGVGLGLSASYGIIHEHGGQITGENRPGGGAIIRVELPITKGEQNAPTKKN